MIEMSHVSIVHVGEHISVIITNLVGKWCWYLCEIQNKSTVYITQTEELSALRKVCRGLHGLYGASRFRNDM